MSRWLLLLTLFLLPVVSLDVRGAEPFGAANRFSGEMNAEDIPIPPSLPRSTAAPSAGTPAPKTGQSMTTIVGGLAVCLALFFLFVWVTKRHAPPGQARLPAEVVESLGRAPLSGRQQLQLIRLGRKLVLLNVTPHGAEALTEIVEPGEVDRLVGLCQQASPSSVTASFREVLTHYEEEPAAPGFLGEGTSDWELANRTPRRRPTRKEQAHG